MEDRMIDTIEKIIELIENDKYKAYMYENSKFRIVDKDNNLDFTAKLAFNNYYYRDNINKLTYIKTRKFLGKDFTVQQILVEDGINNEKCYYSYLERDSYTCLVSVVRSDSDGSLVCINNKVANHSWEDVLAYAKETFEEIGNYLIEQKNEDTYVVSETDLDEDFDDDSENDYDYGSDDDSNQISDEDQQESLQDYYNRYRLLVNETEVDGEAKMETIHKLQEVIEKIYGDSILLDYSNVNLKMVLEAKIKSKEREK